MRSLVLTIGLVVLGCTPASRGLRWEIEFDDPALADRAARVVGRILEGGCAGGTVSYVGEAGRGETPSMPSALPAGHYGFEGVARDADCVEFARGCVEVDLPRPEDDTIVVRLLAATESSACAAASCNGGRCDEGDAGPMDAGPRDTGPRDTGPMDGGADTGDSGLRDTGVDAPADGGVPRLVSSYAVGAAFVCAITPEDWLYCWGSNLAGQLGDGASGAGTERDTPARVGTGATWSMVGAGDEHACGTLGVDLYCWGDNEDGQILTGDLSNRSMPTRAGTVVGPFDAIVGSTMGDSTCVLRPSGAIECVGQNDYGQLGLGDNVDHPALGAWTGTYLSLGVTHHSACGVRMDGALLCTGRNSVGQLGLGTTGTGVNVPTVVGAGLDWTLVDGGDNHLCGLRGAGELWCWGQGTSGRLGTGSMANATAPTRIGTDADWTAVSGGGGHTCGLRGTGELWCWGSNVDGQLGTGSATDAALSPERVGTFSDWTSVDAGRDFTCASRGTALYCWGANEAGQLGQGDLTSRNTPALVRVF